MNMRFETQKEMFDYIIKNWYEVYQVIENRVCIRDTKTKGDKRILVAEYM